MSQLQDDVYLQLLVHRPYPSQGHLHLRRRCVKSGTSTLPRLLIHLRLTLSSTLVKQAREVGGPSLRIGDCDRGSSRCTVCSATSSAYSRVQCSRVG